MAAEMQKISENHHPIKSHNGLGAGGTGVGSLSKFLKKSGEMSGADTEPYYWGNMLLEKLRIWNDEKKSKAREAAEKKYVAVAAFFGGAMLTPVRFPNGRHRGDPKHMRFTVMRGESGPSYSEAANMGRHSPFWD